MGRPSGDTFQVCGMGRREPGCQRANAEPVNENEAVDSSIYDSCLPGGAVVDGLLGYAPISASACSR